MENLLRWTTSWHLISFFFNTGGPYKHFRLFLLSDPSAESPLYQWFFDIIDRDICLNSSRKLKLLQCRLQNASSNPRALVCSQPMTFQIVCPPSEEMDPRPNNCSPLRSIFGKNFPGQWIPLLLQYFLASSISSSTMPLPWMLHSGPLPH